MVTIDTKVYWGNMEFAILVENKSAKKAAREMGKVLSELYPRVIIKTK